MADAFENILGQPKVREFLRASVVSERVTQAYLFVGPAGSNKTQAAYALAQALLCPKGPRGPRGGSCGACDRCGRILRRKHPDVRYFAPAGANGYLVEQVREIVADTALSPIQADKKIYILDRVDQLGASAANAFLKTLEEPADDVVMILLGRTRESVLPTIVSRCQVVPFRHIPASEAAGIVAQNTGAQKAERIRKGIRSALWVSVGFCLVSSLLVCLFAAPLMGLFVEPGETEIIAVGVEYLRIEGMCYCGIGILFLLYGLFRGLGRPGVSVVLTVVSLGTRVALAYLLAPIPAVGLKGIWWAVPIGWVLADLAGLVLYRRKPLPAETACAPEG